MDLIAIIICTKISKLAASQAAEMDDPLGHLDQEIKAPLRIIGSEHVSVGSVLEATAIE